MIPRYLKVLILSSLVFAGYIPLLINYILRVRNYRDIVGSTLRHEKKRNALADELKYIRNFGYPAEAHTVITNDGYYLTLIRISHGLCQNGGNATRPAVRPATRPAVLIVSGLCFDATVHVNYGPKKSLGFILADWGFDVWICNNRGTIFSRDHNYYDSIKNEEYWAFGFHEMGVHDVPASIDYILAETKQNQINFMGYSQGATALYITLSEKPEYNKKVKVAVMMAPVAFMENVGNGNEFSIHRILRHIKPFLRFLRLIKMNRIIANQMPPFRKLVDECDYEIFGMKRNYFVDVWNFFAKIIDSFDQNNEESFDFRSVMKHYPSGCSLYQFEHFIQLFNTANAGFKKFDFGRRENLEIYGQYEPPSYNLSNIKIPMWLIYADKDYTATLKDLQKFQKLVPSSKLYRVNDTTFTHIDFFMHARLVPLVYDFICQTFVKFNIEYFRNY